VTTGVIALLGATGYTGRLVADELARRGRPYRLGARSQDRLSRVPRAEHGQAVVVDVHDPSRLDAFLRGATALINTVGPFASLGLPVVEAAVRNGVAYVDSTGEPGFMAEVYRRYAEAPVPVVPACGFDYIPGDLAAAVAARDLGGAVTEIGVHYEVNSMLPSRGTARSALGVIAQGPVAATKRRTVAFVDGPREAIEWPGGERVTVPRHVPAASVAVSMIVPAFAGPGLEVGAAAMAWLAPFLRPLVELMPEGPPPGLRALARYRILAEAIGGGRRAAVLCEGSDPYGMTALFLVEAADRLRGKGAMAPAQALDAPSFLDTVSSDRFRWRRAVSAA
jgi:Saccharopine dehydrogenase NADP binding domain